MVLPGLGFPRRGTLAPYPGRPREPARLRGSARPCPAFRGIHQPGCVLPVHQKLPPGCAEAAAVAPRLVAPHPLPASGPLPPRPPAQPPPARPRPGPGSTATERPAPPFLLPGTPAPSPEQCGRLRPARGTCGRGPGGRTGAAGSHNPVPRSRAAGGCAEGSRGERGCQAQGPTPPRAQPTQTSPGSGALGAGKMRRSGADSAGAAPGGRSHGGGTLGGSRWRRKGWRKPTGSSQNRILRGGRQGRKGFSWKGQERSED